MVMNPKQQIQHFSLTTNNDRKETQGDLAAAETAWFSPNVTPKGRWNNIDDELRMAILDSSALHSFVVNKVFPKLKFVAATGTMMEYSPEPRTLCSLIMKGCNKMHDKAGIVWWENAKKKILTEIKRLQNDATKNMKKAFLGKLRRTK